MKLIATYGQRLKGRHVKCERWATDSGAIFERQYTTAFGAQWFRMLNLGTWTEVPTLEQVELDEFRSTVTPNP